LSRRDRKLKVACRSAERAAQTTGSGGSGTGDGGWWRLPL
jgi:hypothetical protein